MTILEKAREDYARDLAAFKAARDKLTESKRELARLEGKDRLITPEQREQHKRAGRRAQLLRTHPELRKLTKAARRQALDRMIEVKDAPRVWNFYLDDMIVDRKTRELRVMRSNRARFDLYKAGLTVAARMLRMQARHWTNPTEAQEKADNARTIELHLQGLVDASPRAVVIHYPFEWRVISRALRPEGNTPQGQGARKLYALYQHIVRTHREQEP